MARARTARKVDAVTLVETLTAEKENVVSLYDNIISTISTLVELTGGARGDLTVRSNGHALTPITVPAADVEVVEVEPEPQPVKRKRRRQSAAARKATSERMKKYWAKRRRDARRAEREANS
jgi:hypothetical protein